MKTLMIIMFIALIVSLVVCMKQRITLFVLSMYMVEKSIEPPSEEDVDRISRKVVHHWFHRD